MTKFYAKSTNGFYTDEIHDSMPSDAVQISDETYQSLLAAQGAGHTIQGDTNGNPIAVADPAPVAPPAPTLAQLQAQLNAIAAQITALSS